MPDDKVHRDLRLTNPFTDGADVKALQAALNRHAGEFPRILDFKLDEDGVLGPQTLHATLKGARVLGVVRPHPHMISSQHLIIERVQRVLRHPRIRSDAQKQRGHVRVDRLRKQLDRKPDLSGVTLTMTSGRLHWGGANDVMTEFVEPFMVKRGLPIGSGKRTPAQNTAVGGSATSDHLTTHTTTAARDFPTFSGEDDARALAKAMGINGWKPNSFDKFSVAAGGHSFVTQILWGAAIQHGDHVHVGISR